MKNETHSLIAFLAIIVALVALTALGTFSGHPADLAIMTGLIGVLGTFKPRTPLPSSSVVQTGDSATVNEAPQ